VTGGFNLTADFNPGTAVYNVTSAGAIDAFVCKLDSSGSFAWARAVGGTNNENGNAIAVDWLHNVYIAGSLFGTFDINQAAGVYNLTAAGTDIDFFFERMAQCTSSFTIIKAGNVLTAPAGYSSYQWYRNDTAIIWATNASYTITQPGYYYVVAADPNGCVAQSNLISPVEEVGFKNGLSIFPNPTTGIFTLAFDVPTDEVTVIVFNYTGGEVLRESYQSGSSRFSHELDLTMISKGLYLLAIEIGGKRVVRKVVVE
jgi:hypothetical protein